MADPKVVRGDYEVFRLRKARKSHPCVYGDMDTSWFRHCTPIAPGDRYIHVTVFPGHDYLETTIPRSIACCLPCAEGYDGMAELALGVEIRG